MPWKQNPSYFLVFSSVLSQQTDNPMKDGMGSIPVVPFKPGLFMREEIACDSETQEKM